jgi:hypothetical protein
MSELADRIDKLMSPEAARRPDSTVKPDDSDQLSSVEDDFSFLCAFLHYWRPNADSLENIERFWRIERKMPKRCLLLRTKGRQQFGVVLLTPSCRSQNYSK